MDHSEEIINMTANYFGVHVESLSHKTRKREIVVVRQSAMTLLKEFTNLSLKSIGSMFGGRDHSTVLHAITTVQAMIDTDRKYAYKLIELKEKIMMELNIGFAEAMDEDQIDLEFKHLL